MDSPGTGFRGRRKYGRKFSATPEIVALKGDFFAISHLVLLMVRSLLLFRQHVIDYGFQVVPFDSISMATLRRQTGLFY
jgi:hypothetical protein